MIRQEQCDKVCRILDDVLANRPTERDSLIVAVRKAFDALKKQRWIPCSERLPEESQLCLVTEDSLFGPEVHTRCFNRRGDGGFWSGWGSTPVIAWMPLPERYREEQE